MTAPEAAHAQMPAPAMRVLSSEGFRLFFPLAAIHAASWPIMWTLIYRLGLPFAGETPPGYWHANEMIFGTFGAALIGFITTAAPEWTDTKPLRAKSLIALAVLWGAARIAGLTGVSGPFFVLTYADVAWPLLLCVYIAGLSWKKRTSALFGFGFWLCALAAASLYIRILFVTGQAAEVQTALHIAGLAMLGLLGLALARITVPVTNLILDPSEATSPFRPHPGRLHIAPGLTAIAMIAEVIALSPQVRAYLLIAAGAAFMDRIAEAFVGRRIFRAELLALAGSSLFAGLGLMLVGAARLGAPFAETPVWHLALMGGLGLGVLAVLSIAGLRHTGRSLGLPLGARIALLCGAGATLARVLPEMGAAPFPPGPPYAAPALLWAAAFLLWFRAYWPFLTSSDDG
ncbi:MAG: NnrS family protein [Pseudomonadota bacterium]